MSLLRALVGHHMVAGEGNQVDEYDRAAVSDATLPQFGGHMPRQVPALAKAPQQDIIGIKVKFTLESKNRLRRVVFGLEKDAEGETVKWEISFQLFEREKKSDEFGDPLVELEVEVDSKLNSRAEAVAKNGLTPGQAAHAIGPAADDAKAAEEGEIEPEEATGTVEATLRKK